MRKTKALGGRGKRPPSYIPPGPVRDFLMSLSKADLAEISYDYAVRTVGEEESMSRSDLIAQELLQTHVALVHATGRRPRPSQR